MREERELGDPAICGEAYSPAGERPRSTVRSRATPAYNEPIQCIAEGAPVMTRDVAAVLARIVRILRDPRNHEAA